MKLFRIQFHQEQKQYSVIIGTSSIPLIEAELELHEYSHIAIITDTIVAKHHLKSLAEALSVPVTEIILPSGEKYKTIETVQKIWEQLLSHHFDRKSLVINLGGGVIGDMGGFASSTYMRGIDFIQIPTTLLAQVDASVGGKVGVNFHGIKNLLGSFRQPKAVIIDVSFLKTLPDCQINAGFAEIIKHGLIYDEKYFRLVTKKKPKSYSSDELTEIIYQSCKIKSDIVETDETESGSRKLLNFGHTIGHAIESLGHEIKHPLLHGEAVAIGMVGEAKLSEKMGYLEQDDVSLIEDVLKKADLPIRIKGYDIDTVKEKIRDDKKNTHGKVKWTLLKGIGDADYNIECGEKLIDKALKYILL